MFLVSVESLASRVSVEDGIPNIQKRRLIKEDFMNKHDLWPLGIAIIFPTLIAIVTVWICWDLTLAKLSL